MVTEEPEGQPVESEAVRAAKQMNDPPDGPHPGVDEEPVQPAGDDDETPELMP